VHTVIDDHFRIAYAKVHDDETAITATVVLARAVAWYAARGDHRGTSPVRQRIGIQNPAMGRQPATNSASA
jgi:hypothetical protein